MKKAIFGLAALLIAVGAVLTGRTLAVRMPPAAPAAEAGAALPASVSIERAAQRLGEAVRMPTISFQRGLENEATRRSLAAFEEFRDWIEKTYPAFSGAARRDIVNKYSLLFTWEGSEPSLKPVLLMSHMDVVPVVPGTEKDWSHAPFSGAVADGSVWGRGTLDNKGSLVAMLEAADALAAQGFRPKRTIMFAFGHDEEIGGQEGNVKIAELLASRGVRLAFVDDEGGLVTRGAVKGIEVPVALVGVAERGMLSLQLTAHATGGHSSMPPHQEETAVGRLVRAIELVGQNPFSSQIDGPTRRMLEALAPALPFGRRLVFANLWLFEPLVERVMNEDPATAAQLHTTIAPTMLNAGIKENVLPPEARGVVNFRIHPRDTITGVTGHVGEAINDPKVDIAALPGAREASRVSNMDGPAYRLLSETIRRAYPDALVAPNLTVAGTDSRHYLDLTDNVFRFIPIRVTPDELAGFHGTNERITVTTLGEAIGFYWTLMQNLDEPALDGPAGEGGKG